MVTNSAASVDVIVVGLGAMGSAALYHLARRGIKVLGLDQFTPPHTWGSSHGETRVIREAYFEHPIYVPLVQRAYVLWEELEKIAGEQLYIKTGGLMLGSRESTVVAGALQSAAEHRLPHELLDSAEICRRYPALTPKADMFGVLEPRAGIVFPEKAVAAHLQAARHSGGLIQLDEPVLEFSATRESVTVRTASARYTCAKLVLTAGPWLAHLLTDLALPLTIERQVLLWFQALEQNRFCSDHLPIHLWEYEPGKMFYGFPDLGTGVKVAFHHQGQFVAPDQANRQVTEEDVARMRDLLARFLPLANGEFLRGTVCLYTNTPDGHFILDFHPRHPNVLIASPCSGHGFKFASAIGEFLADAAIEGHSSLNLELFRLDRFRGEKSPEP